MKKSAIIIFFVLSILKIQAQDYLISFTGTGATTVVSTVIVDNLTSGATVTLNGGDILHLIPVVGIENPSINTGALRIYPNPMTEETMLTFVSPENGNTDISVVDLHGKTVCQISTLLSSGTHCFRFSGIRKGLYLVKVTGNNYNYSTKLISQTNSQDDASIVHVSSVKSSMGNTLKSFTSTIDMQYTDGDQLLYKGISGIYSTIVTDIPVSNKTIPFNFAACTDADNNNYSIVQIDTRIWMAENINVGVRISGDIDQSNNGILEKYCSNNSVTRCNIYGGLYQWNEMMQYSTTAGVQGICPTAWHIPTEAEWLALRLYLGGQNVAGGKLKETGTAHWLAPNTAATNSTGFTALPASDSYQYCKPPQTSAI